MKKATANIRYTRFGHLAEYKDGFVLENLCLTEKPRIFNPKPRVAAGRYGK
jgi:hypothetical protein